jgi:hypothetical protein
MTNELEQDLRLALSETAAELPSDASIPLLATDYRPRSPLVLPALAVTAATAVGAVLAISLIGLGTDPPRAFAGWSATPTPPSGDQTRKVEQDCRSRLPTSAGIEHAGATTSGTPRPWPIPSLRPPIASLRRGSWRTVLVDTRGPYAMVLFEGANGAAEVSCFPGRHVSSLGGSFGVHPPPPVPAGKLSIVSSGSNVTPRDEGSQHFSRLVGRTGAGVGCVVIRLSDASRVTASCAHGWFLAWWPGTRHLVTTEVATTRQYQLREARRSREAPRYTGATGGP